MKKLNKIIILLLLVITSLSSCNEIEKVRNPSNSTTIEIQEKAKQDTNLYKIVIKGDNLYAINTKTNLVEYNIVKPTDIIIFFFIILIILAIIIEITF